MPHFEKLVAGAVPLELHLHVAGEGVGRGPDVHLDGMVYDERHGDERLDDGGVLAQALDGGSHRGQIHEKRDTREVLKDDAGDDERDLRGTLRLRLPLRQPANVLLLDPLAVQVAKDGFEDDPQTDREARDLSHAGLLDLGQGEEGTLAAGPGPECLACVEGIVH